jgi:membrane protease YdiL (CAAX protease family)
MRPLRALSVYIVVVFIGGALLAPWLYWLAQFFAHEFPHIAHSPFHRFVHRSLLGLSLVGIWPLLKSAGMTSVGEAGLVRPAGHWKQLGGGFLFGFISLAVIAGLALAIGARHLNPMIPPALLAGSIARLALTAVVVAVLEELLFRGAVFGSLRKVFNWVFALALSSLAYAMVHFMAPAKAPEAVTWLSGLELLSFPGSSTSRLQACCSGWLINAPAICFSRSVSTRAGFSGLNPMPCSLGWCRAQARGGGAQQN